MSNKKSSISKSFFTLGGIVLLSLWVASYFFATEHHKASNISSTRPPQTMPKSNNAHSPTTTAAHVATTTSDPAISLTAQETVVANFVINYNSYNYIKPFDDSSVLRYVDPSIAASLINYLHTKQRTYQWYRETRTVDMSSLGVAPDPNNPNTYYVSILITLASPFDMNQYGQLLTKTLAHSYKVTLGIDDLITAMDVVS